MKIFKQKTKTNFVDENNVLVGFDTEEQCYEDFGYVLTETMPSDIQYNPTVHKYVPNGVLCNDIDLSGFVFDTSFFQEKRTAKRFS